MNPAELALEGLEWLLEHADIVKTVGDAIAAGHSKEAIQTAILGLIMKQSEDELKEELDAAEARKK